VPRHSIAKASPVGQDVVVDTGTLRFDVERTRVSFGAILRDGFLGRTSTSGRYENPVKGPSVVVQNVNGERRVLEVTKTMKQARERVNVVENDFKMLTAAQWCERYDVPVSFVSG
jgi:hypothetical protein